MTNVKIIINNKEFEVPSNTTVLQACLSNNIEIPHFCYHDQLSIAGNCRMCLVTVEKSPKPIASCALPVEQGMKVYTNDIKTKKARENVMELLLVNHPLDCPICDQGGECDLQDQAMVYGNDRGRFFEIKRAVEDKNCGPLIKTVMTRCIHCTRCVRYTDEIAGVPVLGTTGRGSITEIGTYIEKMISSEISGNLIDICPVGALTSKPYAFKARPWELVSMNSLDLFDSVHSNIRVDLRGNDIMRIVPSYNKEINLDWISDKIRFSYDGLTKQRLTTPFLNLKKQKWEKSILYTTTLLYFSNRLSFLSKSFFDYKTAAYYKEFIHSIGFEPYTGSASDFRLNFLLGTSISKIIKSHDLYLLIGYDPKWESPILNLRLRQHILKNKVLVFNMGYPYIYNFNSKHLNGIEGNLLKLLEGRHPILRYISKAKNPAIILGSSVLKPKKIMSTLNNLKCKINKNLGVYYMHSDTCQVIKKEMVIDDFTSNDLKSTIVGINSYNFNFSKYLGPKIYIGHHGNSFALNSKVIIPTTTFLEKTGYYMNIEGRLQFSSKITENNTNAKDDITFVKSSLLFFNTPKKLNLVKQLNQIKNSKIPTLVPVPNNLFISNRYYLFLKKNRIINKFIFNFYKTDLITNSSPTMEKCSKILLNSFSF